MGWVAFRSSYLAHFIRVNTSLIKLADAFRALHASDAVSWQWLVVTGSLVPLGLLIGIFCPAELEAILLAVFVTPMSLALAGALGVPAEFDALLSPLLAAYIATHMRIGLYVFFCAVYARIVFGLLPSSWSTTRQDATALVCGAGLVWMTVFSIESIRLYLQESASALIGAGLILTSIAVCFEPKIVRVLILVGGFGPLVREFRGIATQSI
ncbi:hypothetical protein SPRG_15308 [Saprolegnia parasitica CBS 223.65]|uniref:Uncharacterized protein n=1 Tax=Saprolegnia parasitica (strain CBS 223.65) TaxID=695850 RepID=A0A067BY37_SAPPC|nr:hypothetical protein SPRG_15308 [Saprolegnia parasitica CBS 223.65]KDO19502.1 hypothetical protein SPRG_15308 [Saprolegnia parasitica CBS 223.65]|eukprot:XP_012209805.1 hypothetical protein SPRG_15308 [Saprolegnia parasitica CBS 223.65]